MANLECVNFCLKTTSINASTVYGDYNNGNSNNNKSTLQQVSAENSYYVLKTCSYPKENNKT